MPGLSQAPLGVVLAGGQGRRIGGQKAFRRIGGATLLDLAVNNLRPFCPRIMVVGGDLTRLAHLDCELVADRWPGKGPLAALFTALLESDEETLLVQPVDLPLVRPAVLGLLLAKAPGQKAVAVASHTGIEPLLAVYHRSCLPAAKRLIDSGEMRLRMLLTAVGADFVRPEEWEEVDPEGLSLVNVNRPEDLDRVRRLARECGLFDTPSE